MRKFLFIVTISCLFVPAVGYGATVADLEKRIKQMEQQLNELKKAQEELKDMKDEVAIAQEESSDLSAKVDNFMKISGYTDVEYHRSSKTGSKPGFRLHHMSLFFKKRISDKWRFFSEIEYEDAPYFESKTVKGSVKGDGKIFVEAVNLDYLWKPEANFRFGRFFTPAGIWSVDHYPPFVPTQARPMHIRKIFPQVVDGAMVYGSNRFGDSFLNYDLYVGNGEGNTGKKDSNSSKAIGLKASLLLPALKHLEFGGTAYKDTLNSGTEKQAVGAHVKAKVDRFSFQGEYADSRFTPTTGGAYHRKGYYGQLLYGRDKWAVGYRYDFYDKDDRVTAGDQERNSIFANYHVTKDLQFKLEHHFNDFENPAKQDYDETVASIVVNLGN